MAVPNPWANDDLVDNAGFWVNLYGELALLFIDVWDIKLVDYLVLFFYQTLYFCTNFSSFISIAIEKFLVSRYVKRSLNETSLIY